MEPTGRIGDRQAKNEYKGIRVLLSRRWRFSILLFFINILLYMHRVNLSLAVVCMTKDPTDLVIVNSNTSTLVYTNETVFTDSLNNTSASDTFYNDTITGDTYNVISTGTIKVQDEASEHDECSEAGYGKKKEFEPELNWEKTQVSFLLSSYFYGSFFSQVPGGRFADRFGGKHIITGTMVLTATCSLLTPICARTSIWLMFVIRILVGVAGGAVIPVGIAMLSVWAPPEERSTMIAFSASGRYSERERRE